MRPGFGCLNETGQWVSLGVPHAQESPNGCGGQNQWYHFGVGAPPILVYFGGDSDAHCGYGILTHGQISLRPSGLFGPLPSLPAPMICKPKRTSTRYRKKDTLKYGPLGRGMGDLNFNHTRQETNIFPGPWKQIFVPGTQNKAGPGTQNKAGEGNVLSLEHRIRLAL